MIILPSLPADVLLEIVKYLRLPDPISLLMTCKAVHELSNYRTFWISILKTARTERPLLCSSHENLSAYELDDLKNVAFHWVRLEENWSRPFPHIVGPVKSVSCGGPIDIVSIVPGTDIVLLRLRELDKLLCWDVAAATPFNLDPLEGHGAISGASEPYEKQGEYVIALLSMQDNDDTCYINVISVTHKDRKAVAFRKSFEQKSEMAFIYGELFVHQDVVGLVGISRDDDQCVIQAFNVTTRESMRIQTRIHHSVQPLDQIACFGCQGHVYILHEEETCLHVLQCPRDVLPYGKLTLRHSSMNFPREGPFAMGALDDMYDPRCIVLPGTPLYGVNAVFVRDATMPYVNATITTIRFSLNHLSDDSRSPLSFGNGLTTTIAGGIFNETLSLIWLDHSGNNLLALFELSGLLSLQLVRYDRDKASLSIHELRVPESIDLSTICGLAIDETRGAIMLVTATGDLWNLPYA